MLSVVWLVYLVTLIYHSLSAEWQEEIKLPSKVDVYLKPANSEAWARVQGLAQNPRVKTVLPLQKRVLSLIKTMQMRWRSREARLVGYLKNSTHRT